MLKGSEPLSLKSMYGKSVIRFWSYVIGKLDFSQHNHYHMAHNSPIESIINTSSISSIKTKSIWLKTLCLCSILIMINVKYCIVKSCKIMCWWMSTEPKQSWMNKRNWKDKKYSIYKCNRLMVNVSSRVCIQTMPFQWIIM